MWDCGSGISLAPAKDLRQLVIPLYEDDNIQQVSGVGGTMRVARTPPIDVVLAYRTSQERTVSMVFLAPLSDVPWVDLWHK